MAVSEKRNSTSGNSKEKHSFLDMDIGKDFLSSWTSMSMGEGNVMDFDLPPVSKGNKNSFDFHKADIDFNLDGDFGKISSFNIDMSDLDISPPLKKDGKSKENLKESSKAKGKSDCFAFAFDFDELENFNIESNLTKEGSKAQRDKGDEESSPGASSRQDKEDSMHMDQIGKLNKLEDGPQKRSLPETEFNFDLDCLVGSRKEVENPKKSFPSNLADDAVTSVISDARESSPSVSSDPDKEGSMHMNLIGKMNKLEDGPQQRSLSEGEFDFDLDCLVGRRKDVENPKKNSPSNLADDAVTSVIPDVRKVASDKKGCPLPPTIASRELPNAKQISLGPVNLETCAGNDAKQVSSSDYVSDNELSNTSVAQEKVNAADSKVEQDVYMPYISGSTCIKECTMPENLQQPIAILEKNSCEKSEVVVNDHAMDIRERTEPAQINSLVEKRCNSFEKSEVVVSDHVTDIRERIEPNQVNSLVEKHCTEIARSGMLCNTPSARENQETASKNIKLPVVSQPGDLPEKRMNRREPLATSLKSSIQSGKPACSVQKAATEKRFLTLSSKRMGFTQSSIAGGRELDSIQGMRKLACSPMQHSSSKTLLKRDIPQPQSRESCKANIFGDVNAGGLQDGKLSLSSSTIQNKDMVKTKYHLWQTETNTKEPDTLSSSMEIINKAAQGRCNPTTLSSISTTKCNPAEEQKLSSTESGKNTPELCILKHSVLSLDSIKSPITNNLKSGANISQNRTLLKKTLSDISPLPEMQKQVPCYLSMKRKSLEKDAAAVTALHPSKRLSHSLPASRDSGQTTETFHDKKEPSHQNTEDDYVRYATENCQASTYHNSHELQIKEVEISFSIGNYSNINLAETYGKELDSLCNILRKKHDEAKELLVQAIVNSNKMLLLDNPVFEDKIHVTQKLIAGLTLDSIEG